MPAIGDATRQRFTGACGRTVLGVNVSKSDVIGTSRLRPPAYLRVACRFAHLSGWRCDGSSLSNGWRRPARTRHPPSARREQNGQARALCISFGVPPQSDANEGVPRSLAGASLGYVGPGTVPRSSSAASSLAHTLSGAWRLRRRRSVPSRSNITSGACGYEL